MVGLFTIAGPSSKMNSPWNVLRYAASVTMAIAPAQTHTPGRVVFANAIDIFIG